MKKRAVRKNSSFLFLKLSDIFFKRGKNSFCNKFRTKGCGFVRSKKIGIMNARRGTVRGADPDMVHKYRCNFSVKTEIFGCHPEILNKGTFFAEKGNSGFLCNFGKFVVVYKRL